MSFLFRIALIFCVLVASFSPSNAFASRLFDAAAVVTIRNGLPCFFYPQDEEIRKRPYSISYLDVSKTGPMGGGMWVAQISDPYRKGLLEPNSSETCIRYGGPHPGIEDYYGPAKPLLMDTPYEAFIRVSTPEGPLYERKFFSGFCMTRDEKGNKVIVGAQYDDDADKWKCLKPGEKPKKSFWKRLFGK
ncbi:MAG: hypothetical protein ABFD76_17310 [Smithella sp.]